MKTRSALIVGLLALAGDACTSRGDNASSAGAASSGEEPRSHAAGGNGPFGLDSGMTLAQLKSLGKLTPTDNSGMSFSSKSVPKPHPEFEEYAIVVSPTSGLCNVKGMGKTVENDAYGNITRSSFESLRRALDEKYGASELYDFLNRGSIWNEPNDWMMGVRQNERTLSAKWPESLGEAALPHQIHSIFLQTRAVSASDGYLFIEYEFTNYSSCDKERDGKTNSVL